MTSSKKNSSQHSRAVQDPEGLAPPSLAYGTRELFANVEGAGELANTAVSAIAA